MITVDDLRPQLNEAYGMTETITPNLDKFAKGALVFHRAYCQQAVCSPSRNSFMSGRRPVCAVSFCATLIPCVCQFVPCGFDVCVSTCHHHPGRFEFLLLTLFVALDGSRAP
jgi:hypothetical protein